MNLLIVDDEKETRNGLQKHIDWAALGIDQVKTAENGNEAIRLCTRFLPNILLSDIRMPGMDGIALGNYVRERLPDCQIILLSAYTDKEYLKAAIDLEVVSYVEKPINVAEIENTVRKAITRIGRDKNASAKEKKLPQNELMLQQRAVLTLIREGTGENIEKELRELQLFEQKDGWFRVFLFQYPPSEVRSKQELALTEMFFSLFGDKKFAYAFSDSSHAVVLICEDKKQSLDEDSPLIRQIKNQMEVQDIQNHRKLYCAVGESLRGIDNVRQSYQSAVPALQKLFFDGYGYVNFYNNDQNWILKFDDSLFDTFASCVNKKDREGAVRVLNDARRSIAGQKTALPASVKNLYFKFGSLLEMNQDGHGGSKKEETEKYLWEGLSSVETLEELHHFFLQRIEKNISLTEGNAVINKAVSLIEDYYEDENLSAKSLATAVYLTPAYFSSLFKKETGKTVRRYITDVRIRQAKKLLTDTNYKLYYISLAVGYTDASYFARTFKKSEGMMPSEYREKYAK